MIDVFADRSEAGRLLAHELVALKLIDPVVLALPRGGVPVAAEVASALHAPLDLLLVRKIGAPGHVELAVAAVAEGPPPVVVFDDGTWGLTRSGHAYIDREVAAQLREIGRRRATYLGDRPALPIEGKTAVVVDDGIDTGTTVRAGLQALRRRKPARLVLAIPVAPPEVVEALQAEVDDLVCLSQPSYFRAVGVHYVDFHQVSDSEVVRMLGEHESGKSSIEVTNESKGSRHEA
jgi:putative phosphoribosyl transferase